jgi:hypothetical protein
MFRFSWKWRRRSPSKVKERTHEEATEAPHAGRESRHRERYLLENEPISKLCDELGFQPAVFYRWQKEFFENGAAAFEQKPWPNNSAEQERIAYLKKKIQSKDELLAELMAEHVALKKDSDWDLGPHDMRGSDRGFRPALVREDRDRCPRFIVWLDITIMMMLPGCGPAWKQRPRTPPSRSRPMRCVRPAT